MTPVTSERATTRARTRVAVAAGADRPDRRARLRAATVEEIRAAALRQVRAEGATGLSLRAVAREVGLSSAGIYRYYASRDELVTDLVATAYEDLAAAVEAASAGSTGSPGASGSQGPAGSAVTAAADALRDWALAHPIDYALLFDEPIPGYAAPPGGPTVTAAARFEAAVLGPLLAAWRTARPDAADDAAFRAAFAACWTRLHGVLSLHLHGHLAHVGLDDDGVRALYRREVESCVTLLTAPGGSPP